MPNITATKIGKYTFTVDREYRKYVDEIGLGEKIKIKISFMQWVKVLIGK